MSSAWPTLTLSMIEQLRLVGFIRGAEVSELTLGQRQLPLKVLLPIFM